MTGQRNVVAFNILIKKEGSAWTTHCLELDIVATGDSHEEAYEEIIDLIVTQVSYAFSNDNIENLYHPAPSEIWEEFYECSAIEEKEVEIKKESDLKKTLQSFVPPWIIAKAALCEPACGV